jgi:CO/xanthine dehydrogenase Mo-binding subunit
VPGVVQVVEVSAGIAVLARDTFAALSGRDALTIDWDEGPNAALTTAELLRRLDAAAAGATRVSRRDGDANKALAGAATRISGTWRDAFQAHATVEPQNACARVSGGSCEIWAPTQNPQRVQKEAAKLLGIPPEKVTVYVTLIGGGFGRRLGADYATEAAEVARAAG